MDISLESTKKFTSTQYIQSTESCSYIDITVGQAVNLVNNAINKKDLAKQIQYETKVHTCNLIQKAIDMSNNTNVILSGGYFLNTVNNKEYIKEFPNVNFYIDPIAHDGGTAIGAAYYLQSYNNKDTYDKNLY